MSPTSTASVSKPDGHIVDPDCQSRGSHGYLRAYSHHGCRCPGPGMEQYQAYRERQAIAKRASYVRVEQAKTQRALGAERTKPTRRFPTPPSLIALWDREDRACLGTDSTLWHPIGHGDEATIRQAKTICGVCPARELCLRAAFESGDDFAVMGKTTPKERRKLRENGAEGAA